MSDFRTIFSLRDLAHFGALAIILFVGTLLELSSLGAVPVFVSLVTMPDPSSPVRLWLLHAIDTCGFAPPDNLTFCGGIALIALFLLRTSFLLCSYMIQERILCNRQIALSSRLFNAYMNAPYEFHLARNSSTPINNTVNETDRFIRYFLDAAVNLCRHAIVILAIIVMLLAYDPIVSLASFTALALSAGTLLIAMHKKIGHTGNDLFASRQRSIQIVSEGIGAFREALILDKKGYFSTCLHQSLETMLRCQKFYTVLNRSLWPLMEFVTVLILLGTMLVMISSSTTPADAAPTIALVAVCLARLKGTITEFMQCVSYIKVHKPIMKAIATDLRELENHENTPSDGTIPPLRCIKHLKVRNLSYKYPETTNNTVKNISFDLPATSSLAIVGPTGSGKTTLANLVIGLLNPQSGEITVDDVSVTPANLRAWQNSIGYVPQDIFLLDASLRANIAFGIPEDDIDQKALEEAIRIAQLQEFIDTLPEHLDTLVGEHGVRLSGGQRQRIAIARAIYRSPDILIFDEATSALDNTTEKAVVESINALKGKHTIIVIAHRLTTMKNCDRLIYLKDGSVAGEGSFEELRNTLPDFMRMTTT